MEHGATVAAGDPPMTPYKVSTITAVATLSTLINLEAFFWELPISRFEDGGYVFAGVQTRKTALDDVGRVLVRGVRPPRRKQADRSKNPKPPRLFDHQVTVVYVLKRDDGRPDEVHNIKVFHTGNVQMTGVKSLDGGETAVRVLAETVTKMAMAEPAVLTLDQALLIAPPKAANFRACLINSDFKAGYVLRRDRLCEILTSPMYDVRCIFETYYPAVKVQFMWNSANGQLQDGVCRCPVPCVQRGNGSGRGSCRKITISIFQSGCCIITGAHTYRQLDDAYAFITGVLSRHRALLRRPGDAGLNALPRASALIEGPPS